MAFCSNCGTKVEDGVKFCPGCGAALPVGEEKNTAENQQTEAVEQTQQAEQIQSTEQGSDLSSKVANLNNTADTTADYTPEDIEQNKVMGLLAYILFFIPLLAAKDSPFARYHANQGLVLFLCALVSGVIFIIPILGWIIAPILSIVITVLAVIGIINALNGKAKELPIIGKFKILK